MHPYRLRLLCPDTGPARGLMFAAKCGSKVSPDVRTCVTAQALPAGHHEEP